MLAYGIQAAAAHVRESEGINVFQNWSPVGSIVVHVRGRGE